MLLRVGTFLSSHTGTGEGTAPFDPLSLSPYSWFDVSDTSTLFQDTAGTSPVTADGQSVARINDKSGLGRHMIQGTAAARPLYKTAGGLHWLLFDGVNDLLYPDPPNTAYDYVLPSTHEATAAASHLSLSSGITGSVWMYHPSAGGVGVDIELSIFNSSGTYRIRQRYPSIDTSSTGSAISSPTTAAHVLAMDRRATNDHRQYIDGVQTFSTTTSSTMPTTSGRGNGVGRHGANAQYLGMRWYGAVITAPLTTDQRAALTTYMGAKAGLTL